jgi:AGZA family xanthine/uracil permease-like MFS transporter
VEAGRAGRRLSFLVRGDVDGFFGLALDNLVQLLLIDTLCRTVLGMSSALLYGRILPGAAVSLIVGNCFYAWQARRLAARTGRTDVCALPYGINTVSLFGHVYLIMLPAKLVAEAAGAADPVRVAWEAGLVACFASGLIELVLAPAADVVRRVTPRAALLSTLSGIALGFISLGFFYRTFARPIVGLTTLAIVLVTYFGRVRLRAGLPGGLVAVAIGTLLAWLTGIAPGQTPPVAAGLHLPVPVVGDLLTGLEGRHLLAYFSVILPMGLFNVVGSLQNIESAEAAGDAYPTAPSLAMNGLGSIAAACFGSCFPTTIYIGHPGWKAMGARSGYSVLNAIFATIVCLTGTVSHIAWGVPIDAGMAIVLWIGLLPGVGAWGALMAKNGLRAAGVGMPGGPPFSPALIPAFEASDTWIGGAFALEQGFIFTAMILSAMTVAIIERRFTRAAAWCALAAGLAACGLMDSYRWTPGDTAIALRPAWEWTAGYGLMALWLLAARWVTVESDAGH